MLPERRLMAVRVRSDGRTEIQVQRVPASTETLATGLAFWASLFALSVIAALI